jgi:hypothetical protein
MLMQANLATMTEIMHFPTLISLALNLLDALVSCQVTAPKLETTAYAAVVIAVVLLM